MKESYETEKFRQARFPRDTVAANERGEPARVERFDLKRRHREP